MENKPEELEKRNVHPYIYALSTHGGFSNGTLDDVFHPQARYTRIDRVHDACLQVEGSRPRVLGFGVKRFIVSISLARPSSIQPSENDTALMDELQRYLLRY